MRLFTLIIIGFLTSPVWAKDAKVFTRVERLLAIQQELGSELSILKRCPGLPDLVADKLKDAQRSFSPQFHPRLPPKTPRSSDSNNTAASHGG